MNTARQANRHAPRSNLAEMYPGIYRPGSDSTRDGDDSPTHLELVVNTVSMEEAVQQQQAETAEATQEEVRDSHGC